MLQTEEIGGKVITAAYEMDDLFRNDFEGYAATMNRRLRNLDAQIAAKEALDNGPTFREAIAAAAVEDLAALGVPHPRAAWRLGVTATRTWLLEIASPTIIDPFGRWSGTTAIAPADSPFGEWQLWRHTVALAEHVRAQRITRNFGPSEMTAGDLEEARLKAQIDAEQWTAIRERAMWVLR